MNPSAEVTADEQTGALTDLYSARAEANDSLKDQYTGLIDVELANPLDSFARARGEESAREFGTLGYSIRARLSK